MNANIFYDLPFYLVVCGVIGNLLIGIIFKISFAIIMIRSIVVTILFSIIGYFIALIYKEIKLSPIFKDSVLSNKQTIDYTIPPISDDEFVKYNEDEDFVEMNPAEIYKYKASE